jgi:alpha,alpha-trehalase
LKRRRDLAMHAALTASSALLLLLPGLASHVSASPRATVKEYVTANYEDTFRPPSGILVSPYLVPAGPYSQCWDWDSVFTGLALLPLGSAEYLAGSMSNFFSATNSTNGAVTICLDPSDPHPSCSSDPSANAESGSHAKPLLIQGAFLAATEMGDYEQFRQHKGSMAILLEYWTNTRRTSTGLYTWHDQMESGADDLPTSPCPSPRSPECWSEAACGNSLVAPDLLTFLIREHRSFARFVDIWEGEGSAEAESHRATAADIATQMTNQLWTDEHTFRSFNATSNTGLPNDVYNLAFPLFAGEGVLTKDQAAAIVKRIFSSDMMSEFGVRSTSSLDPTFNNEPTLTPYSNWQGPVWVVANAVITYGLLDHGFLEDADDLANRTIHDLAADIVSTGTWHEAFDSSEGGDGAGLSAEGFLSWNTLGYRLLDDVEAKTNPFKV